MAAYSNPTHPQTPAPGRGFMGKVRAVSERCASRSIFPDRNCCIFRRQHDFPAAVARGPWPRIQIRPTPKPPPQAGALWGKSVRYRNGVLLGAFFPTGTAAFSDVSMISRPPFPAPCGRVQIRLGPGLRIVASRVPTPGRAFRPVSGISKPPGPSAPDASGSRPCPASRQPGSRSSGKSPAASGKPRSSGGTTR